jgi:uncharacterized Zn finger protein
VPTDETKGHTIALSPKLLRRLAGERFFDRGEAYFAAGAVRSLRKHGNGVKAAVQGTRRYRVQLWAEDGDLGFDCSCPIGREGAFCKHCVAVGLTLHAGGQNIDANFEEDAETAFEEVDLRGYLLGLDKEELVSLLVDQADGDARLHRRLTLRAAHATPKSAELSVWKDALADALETDDFVHYRDAYDYASGVEEVIETLEDLLQSGQADSVIQLAEHGLAEVEQSLEYMDDSDGWMGGMLGRLQELHLEACRLARPDPVDLAERLFEGEMESSFDTFYKAALVYADVLGEAGLAAYRRLVEADWAKIPALKPGEEDPNRYGSRYRTTSIMEALAEASDDLGALVAIKSHDLSAPYAFLEIAKLYQEAGDPELALDWAERGWRAFSGTRRDERLRAFLADVYQSRGRSDEAMTLIWEAFVDYPRLETYRDLESHGRRAKQWSGWREKALAVIRERVADETAEPSSRRMWTGSPSQDHSLLVRIFLHEGDPQAAWREAKAGGCSQGLWLELAKRRQKTHPEDSVRIYKAHVASLLRNTGDRVYEEAVGFIGKIGALLAGSGQEASFEPFLDEIRTTHKRKRNLMKMFDRKGW